MHTATAWWRRAKSTRGRSCNLSAMLCKTRPDHHTFFQSPVDWAICLFGTNYKGRGEPNEAILDTLRTEEILLDAPILPTTRNRHFHRFHKTSSLPIASLCTPSVRRLPLECLSAGPSLDESTRVSHERFYNGEYRGLHPCPFAGRDEMNRWRSRCSCSGASSKRQQLSPLTA
jgi:hypothetical protein